jgi:alkanesulfonate monooxygenase SsuD/methylene tetrahydromethanopterin reductase-like flavin-dependent oxidoreductase (luciferase family)
VPLEPRSLLREGNRLKLALFGANCSSGRTYATLPERWDASWDNNLALARLADELGLEGMIPIARWKGYGGRSNPNGASLESIAWASGLLASTSRVHVFATVHVPLVNPLLAAKQLATADLIGHGRLGLNLVCGWNEDEFAMFGVDKLEHEERYAQGDEWWQIVQRVWSAEAPFDFSGRHYELRGVEGAPPPYGGSRPIVMNAGSSPSGRDFAIRNTDMHFESVRAPEASRERIADTKRLAAERGKPIQVWTPVGVVCRPTQAEADDYMEWVLEHADAGAIGHLAEMHARDAHDRTDPEGMARRAADGPRARQVLARGAYCTVGDPDRVARDLAELSEVGFDGLAINFVDYLAELPLFAREVLPRLEERGLRAALATPSRTSGARTARR